MRRLARLVPLAALLLAAPAAAKDPALGGSTFYVFEAWLSPAQEPAEETDMPKFAGAAGLANTRPSTPRAQRPSRGWGQIRFARDMSRAEIEVNMKGVDPAEIVMFHIHCGRPGVLGPILVDLGEHHAHGAAHGEGAPVDWSKAVVDGRFQKTITNGDINTLDGLPKGLAPRLPEACPIGSGPPSAVKTVAGMYHIAREGLLYFNLHTKAHTFYGEMRGQIYPAAE